MPDRRLVLALILLGFAVRGAAVLALQSHTVPNSTYEHGEIAANLLAGRGFSTRFLGAEGPTSQQAPIYPLIVAGAYAVGGVGQPGALLLLELGQAALGGLLVSSVLALAREVAPGKVWMAGLAGLIVALHPTLVYAATHVQVALLAATLLTATLASAYRTGRTGRNRDAAVTGLGLAALTLTDPILGLAAPGVAWAIALRGSHKTLPLAKGELEWVGFDRSETDRNPPRSPLHEGGSRFLGDTPGADRRRAARLLAVVVLVAAAGVAPWVVRNARVHGEVVWIKSTFGYAFWQGNSALSMGTDKVVRASVERTLKSQGRPGLRGLNETLWAARHEAGYLDDIALTPADYRELARVSEPERSRRLFRRALADLRADPGRYPRLCLRRLRYFVLFDETNPKTRNPIYRVSHLGLTILAVFGWAFMRPELRRRLGPTLLTACLIALFHALTIVSARFHVPIEPLMALWAASGISRWSSGRPVHDVVVMDVGHGLGTLRLDV